MKAQGIDILWIVVASGLVFIMQAGFAMLESGLTRSKNSINVAMKNLSDLGISIFLYWLFGFAIMFGTSWNGFLGTSHFAVHPANNAWVAAFLLFQSMFCSTAATIVSGAVAERMRFSSYIIATIIIAALIYPVFGHWAWGGALTGTSKGWLAQLGFIDFAGSTVVHSVGGWMALASILIIGPRAGRFDEAGKTRPIQGSNLTIAVLGVILLWFGWFGFNGGSTLSMSSQVAGIIFRTTIAASTGMISAMIIGWIRFKRAEVSMLLNGAIAGLVAITASVHIVHESNAAIIGAIGAVFMYIATFLLERFKIDDAVGAIPAHLAAGIWGTIAVALFGDPIIGKFTGGVFYQLQIQLLGIIVCGTWSFGVAWITLKIINVFIPLRVTLKDEEEGLNFSEHKATTEFYDLFNVMEKQAKNADLSLRVPSDPFTESGQIALRYNTVLDSLESTMNECYEQTEARVTSESRYKTLVEGSDLIIFSMTKDMIIEHVNKSVKKHFKIKPQDIIGKNFSALIHAYGEHDEMEMQMIESKLQQLWRSGESIEINTRLKSPKNLDAIDLLIRLEPVTIGSSSEILGRGYRITEETLNRFLNHERLQFSLENMLTTADDITHRLTRNLRPILEDAEVMEIRIALREVIINAIEHGNLAISFEKKTQLMIEGTYFDYIAERQKEAKYKDKKVDIDYLLKKDKVTFRITDQGKGFNHAAAMNSSLDDVNGEMLTHGRGLKMVLAVFDEVEFNRKGNQVLLVKKLS
jgi:ammonium transporter